MSQFTLLYGARQLLTLRGPSRARRKSALLDLGIIENGSVLIENGLIHAVGPTRRIENLKQARNATTIDVSGGIIMPGLVDPDVNITYGMTGTSVRNRRAGRMYEEGVSLLRSCLQHGTCSAVLNVTAEDGDIRSDATLLRQMTKIGVNPVDIVRNWNIGQLPRTQFDFENFKEALSFLHRKQLLDSLKGFCDSTSTPTRDWLSLVRSTGLPTHLQWKGIDGEVLTRLMQQTAPLSVSCSSSLTASEIGALSRSNAVAVFCPGAEISEGTGTAARELADTGGAFALSSGYHPVTAPGFSMQMAISLAIVQGKLTSEEAISAATVNAAYAAGRGHLVGTLEQGKQADLIVMTVPDYREIARQFGINHVATVVRNGNVVFNRARWKIGAHEVNAARVRSQHLGRA